YTAIPAIRRYGSMVLPMDDALCEAVIDLCNRPYLVYQTHWPQAFVGQLDVSLFREFFQAFVSNARCNLHLHCRWGENSHHIIEAIFKAFGIALNQAAKAQKGSQAMSTKGSL
ncbi:MAG: imidazoleglycerol-phosphate dehydratase HisB, partial [Spirochaetaceae bacterium]